MKGAIAAVLLTVTVVGVAGWLTHQTQTNRLVWDHFGTVKPGFLYRSGQLEADQLEEAVRKYRLKTVVSFQVDGPDVRRERAIARKLGIDFVNLPMPGDGSGLEGQFREVLKIVDDPARRPALIHCARGTCRTGAAVALYRFERDGWTVEDVAAEMERQAYRDGWLPGYVYGMVKERPFNERFEPAIQRDANLARSAPEPPVRSTR
jgi:protein tyrosine/serine phosphatase